METILIWLGSGFAFAVGVALGAWAVRKTSSRKPTDQELLASRLLAERNDIGRQQVEALERIAATFEEKHA